VFQIMHFMKIIIKKWRIKKTSTINPCCRSGTLLAQLKGYFPTAQISTLTNLTTISIVVIFIPFVKKLFKHRFHYLSCVTS
jgi:hypothetical protein